MKRIQTCLILIGLLCISNLYATDNEKAETIRRLRQEFTTHINGTPVTAYTLQESLALIDAEGRFTDKRAEEEVIIRNNYAAGTNMAHCIQINNLTRDCFERLQVIAESYRGKKNLDPQDNGVQTLLRGIAFYGKMENERNNDAPGRFHASCFATPRAAVKIYFALLDLMDRIETGEVKDSTALVAHQKLFDVGFQSWTQPYRHDETDKNVVSVERFRKHVWWVGGNALDYRPVLEAAVMMSSVPMIDVLAEVAIRSLSVVSQTTYDEAFWTEGTTADGAGWGHGKQCLVWGYPIDGLKGTFRILKYLQGSPWAKQLSRENVEVVLNYIRCSAFYHHKGIIPPLVDRGNMTRKNNRRGNVPSHILAKTLLADWRSSLTPEEVKELKQFVDESSRQDVQMASAPDGYYHGTRYFYNNDDLIKKTNDYYLFINMGSVRVDGLESAYPGAAGYNLYSADGVTLFQHDGSEYRNITGAMKLTAWPGVTTRQTPTEPHPIENWSGYTSSYDFAAGATDGKGDFATGFIYQKINAKMKGDPDVSEAKDVNKDIYGVRAYKSYFMFDDIFLALGAGITNLSPEKKGSITTTIEQTYSPVAPEMVKKGKISWIRHEGFTYGVIPQQTSGDVKWNREERATNWQRLCKANTEPETTVPVFQMEIVHGREIKDATYAYVVDCKGEFPQKIPAILANTPHLQAAENPKGTKLGAVYFDTSVTAKGKFGTFRISSPAALFAEKKDGKLILTVTDALMKKDLNSLTVYTSVPVRGEGVSKQSKNIYEIKIPLPAGAHCGQPATVTLELL